MSYGFLEISFRAHTSTRTYMKPLSKKTSPTFSSSLLRTSSSPVSEVAEEDVLQMFFKDRELNGDFISKTSDMFWLMGALKFVDFDADAGKFADNSEQAHQVVLLPKSLLLQHSTTKAVYDADFCTLILQLKRELMLLSVGIGTAWSGYCLITLSVQNWNKREDLKYFLERSFKGSSLALLSPRLVIPATIYGLWVLSHRYFANAFFDFQIVPAMFGMLVYKAAVLVQVYRDSEDLQLVFPENEETSTGGSTLARDSNRSRKNYARYAMTSKEVFFNTPAAKRARVRQVPIMWTDEDEEEILYPHEDALVIKVTVLSKKFDRILIDTGSSVDVLFKSTLEEMGIADRKLEYTNTSLKGFGGEKLVPLGVVELPITIGSSPTERTMILDFVVVDEEGPYQMILGRPFLRMSKAVLSIHYLALKYWVNRVVGVVRGDQRIARSCYSLAAKEAMQITSLNTRVESKKGRQEPVEELETVSVGPENPGTTIRIGSKHKEEQKQELVKCLQAHADVLGIES
ncbi:hypothetical protein KPL70_023952 [Citrus sinensis]|nr:hypothetical protein KPL70_023952 [Citrus sinensis]